MKILNKIIEKKVSYLKHKYKTNDPFELCDYLNIKVLFEDLGPNINGFFQSAPQNRIIHINYRLDEQTQLMTCAHELCHALFHYKLNVLFLERNTFFHKNKLELEADMFAAKLIIDDNLLKKYEGFCIETISNCENIDRKYINLKFDMF